MLESDAPIFVPTLNKNTVKMSKSAPLTTLEDLLTNEKIKDLQRQIKGLELTLQVRAYSKKYHEFTD
jgi:hypothetical protein